MMFAVPSTGRLLLAGILATSLFLNTYGISFGLPYRWNVDETVTAALRVGATRSLIYGDIRQTHFHTYALTLFMAPYVAYAKLTRDDFPAIREGGAVSWNRLVDVAPDFATNVYRVARFSSALIGTVTVFLVYRLGTVLWGMRAGLMAAALLALTQGFIGSSHFARSEPLVNCFGVLVLYLLVRSLEPGPKRRRFFLAGAFFAGLAFATKYNGLVLIGSIGLAWLWFAWEAARRSTSRTPLVVRFIHAVHWRWLLVAAALYGGGVLLGQPTLFDMLRHYDEISSYWGLYFTGRTTSGAYIAHVVNYLLQLVVIYGVPLSLFVATGIGMFLREARRSPTVPGGALVLITACAYFVLTCDYPWPQPWIKFIIFIVPLLAVFGGLALARFSSWGQIPFAVRATILTVVFGYSLWYGFSVDELLAREDIRYQSTQWIEANIPVGSSIEHIQEDAWLYSPRIVPQYDIVYFGRHSRNYQGSLFRKGDFRVWEKETVLPYLASLVNSPPQADYFILWIEDLAELQGLRPVSHPQERFLALMFSEKLGYRLIQRFQSPNYRIPLEAFPQIYYPRSFWWNPTFDYTPVEIRIYQRESTPSLARS